MNIKTVFASFLLLIALILSGCIPEDSIKWSKNGSIGVLKINGSLYLVDGKTGSLTCIENTNLMPGQDISLDGNVIIYGREVNCPDLQNCLKQLPSAHVQMLKNHAAKISALLNNGTLDPNQIFQLPKAGPFSNSKYYNWIIRYICENFREKSKNNLPAVIIENAKKQQLSYFELVAVSPNKLSEKRIIAKSLFTLLGAKISPDGKSAAYLMHTQQGRSDKSFQELSLFVASMQDDNKAMLIDSSVAFGYDWSKNSRLIAFWRANSSDLQYEQPILGELKEIAINDASGQLLAQKDNLNDAAEKFHTHICTGAVKQIAGSIFYPWIKVQYGPGDRMYFSSLRLSLPSSSLDEAKWSLFCYDPVVGTVSDVLPPSMSIYMGQPINSFELSSDGKMILLPIENNRFEIYEFGAAKPLFSIPESDGFGEKDTHFLAPAWKNNEISCLVSGNSHFLKTSQRKQNEMLIIDINGKLQRILSKDWDPNTLTRFK